MRRFLPDRLIHPSLLLWLSCLAYALGYAWLSLARFQTFHGQIDLSYYVRIVWGLSQGQYDVPLVQSPHLIGLHLEPILLPFAGLARLGVPIAPLLLVTQAVCVALWPQPIYRLACRHLGCSWRALGLALCGFLYPTVTVATLHDVHPVTMALPLLAAWLDALDEGNLRRALLWGLLALLCREDIALQQALVLWALAVTQPQRRWMFAGLGLLLLAYFGVYIVAIQPRFLPKLGSYGLHFASEGAKVSSGRDLLWLLVRHPLRFVLPLVTWDRAGYLLSLLWPLVGLPLLGWRVAVGALPIVGINFLSSFPRVRSIESHYSTALVPFLLMATVIALGKLRTERGPRLQTPLTMAMLLGCLLSHVLHGGSPLARRSSRYSHELFVRTPDHDSLTARIASVPSQASVAARPGPLAHLADRPRVISPPEYDDGQPVDVVLTPDAAPQGRARIGNLPLHSQ